MCKILAIGITFTFIAQLSVQAADATKSGTHYGKPNIVIFFADDLGWADISTSETTMGYASKKVETPNIDKLAKKGMSFTAAYTQQNCAPTRASLISGQYPTVSGVYNVGSLMRVEKERKKTLKIIAPKSKPGITGESITYADVLTEAGYRNAIFGKVHGWGGGEKIDYGFQDDYSCSKAMSRMEGKKKIKLANYEAYNDNGTWRMENPRYDKFAKPYDAAYINKHLTRFANNNDPKTLLGKKKHFTDAMVDAALEFLDSAAKGNQPFSMWISYHAIHSGIVGRPDLIAKYQAKFPHAKSNEIEYLALTEQMDQSTARILADLDQRNLRENTLVLFLSDNGAVSKGNNGPLRGYKGMFYEGGIRVPFIAEWAGRIKAGSISHEPIHVIDLFPTFAELAGSSVPDQDLYVTHGESILSILTGKATQLKRQAIYWHFPGYMDVRQEPNSVINKRVGNQRYKLRYSYETEQYELYNLNEDISESKNLLNNSPEMLQIARNLRADLCSWIEKTKPAPMKYKSSGEQVGLPLEL